MANINQEEMLKQYYELHPELAPKKPGLDPMFLENLIQNKGNPIPNPPMSVGSNAPFYSEADHPMSMPQPVKPESSPMEPPPEQQIPYSAPRSQTPIRQVSDEEALGGMRSQPQMPENLSNIMFGQNQQSTVENLKKAQQARDDERGSARRDRLAALLGSSASGIKNDYLLGEADRKDKLAPEKITDLEQQTAMQKNDPNSAVSKGYRELMKKKWDIDIGGDASATDIEKIAPWIVKAKEGEETRENARLLSKDKALDRNAYLKIKGQEKDEEISNKDALKLEDHLDKGWAARGGQAGVIQGKINAAEAAEALVDQGKMQSGGLDSRQIEELAQSTARLLGGNNTASARVEALVPHTLSGKAQSLKEFLTNEPQGQQMQLFTDRLAETVRREKELAQTQKRQFQVGGLAAHERLRTKNEKLYNKILQSKGIDTEMIDEKGMYKPPNAEERRQTKDGRTAVFDSKTKAFLRYE